MMIDFSGPVLNGMGQVMTPEDDDQLHPKTNGPFFELILLGSPNRDMLIKGE
jgi:hypothetical protein